MWGNIGSRGWWRRRRAVVAAAIVGWVGLVIGGVWVFGGSFGLSHEPGSSPVTANPAVPTIFLDETEIGHTVDARVGEQISITLPPRGDVPGWTPIQILNADVVNTLAMSVPNRGDLRVILQVIGPGTTELLSATRCGTPGGTCTVWWVNVSVPHA